MHADPPLSNPMWTPRIQENISEQYSKSGITSFTFRVNFPVVVRAIRVWSKAFQGSSSGYVNLKAARNGGLVTSVSFEQPTNKNGWMEIKTKPFLLPRSYDAQLEFFTKNIQNETIIDKLPVPCYGVSSWFNFGGSIEFTTQYGLDSGWVKFDENSCAPISLLLELKGIPFAICRFICLVMETFPFSYDVSILSSFQILIHT